MIRNVMFLFFFTKSYIQKLSLRKLTYTLRACFQVK